MSTLPTSIWRALAEADLHRDTPKGLDALWLRGMGIATRLRSRTGAFLASADAVLAHEKEFAGLSSAGFREHASALRALFRSGRDTADDLARAFALVREAAWRELAMRQFPVQIAGGLAIASGAIAEMATGEGKTLTATLPATIAGWRGRGCHVITVNDYLARRDAEWMEPVYRACGVSVAWIAGDASSADRRAAYGADVTYATNKEVAADFLRDRLLLGESRTLAAAMAGGANTVSRLGGLVQRGLECAIVDEADSVLIDEAVTPLIIAGRSSNAVHDRAFIEASRIAAMLEPRADYTSDHRHNEVRLTAPGRAKALAAAAPLGGIWSGQRRAEELIIQALTARNLFHRDKHYLVQNDAVVIVDDRTGRAMPDRTWRDGLHQAIEAKESLTINAPKETLARISFQRFFRLYRRLAGMTGTALEESRELWGIYRRPVVTIPPNRPCIRVQHPDRVFARAEDKWEAIADEIVRLRADERPVLVGSRTVAQSEHLSELLARRGVAHEVLNAQRHDREAAIIANAGDLGRVTIATNMAGRGTDIRLGPGAAARGGLHVIAAEHHDSPRVDRQLFGRAARQGDPGSAQVFMSLEDELFIKHAPRLAGVTKGRSETWPLRPALTRALVRLAQRDAARLSRSSRASVLRADDWLDEALGFAAAPV